MVHQNRVAVRPWCLSQSTTIILMRCRRRRSTGVINLICLLRHIGIAETPDFKSALHSAPCIVVRSFEHAARFAR